mgnify:CR=1 FL=1
MGETEHIWIEEQSNDISSVTDVSSVGGNGGSGHSFTCAMRLPIPQLPRHLPLALVGSEVVDLLHINKSLD